MKEDKGGDGVYGEGKECEAEDPDLVEPCWSLGEAQPAKGQGEGDGARENHSPEDALVHYPAVEAALTDKLLRK